MSVLESGLETRMHSRLELRMHEARHRELASVLPAKRSFVAADFARTTSKRERQRESVRKSVQASIASLRRFSCVRVAAAVVYRAESRHIQKQSKPNTMIPIQLTSIGITCVATLIFACLNRRTM